MAILEHLHQYVPTSEVEETIEIEGQPERKVIIDHFHYLLFGGDLLTEMRAGTARNIRNNSERGRDRLEGLLPVIEDWHTKVCLLEVRLLTMHFPVIYTPFTFFPIQSEPQFKN